jgi:hypothetical protein
MAMRCGPNTRCMQFVGQSKVVQDAIRKGAPRQITIPEARKIDKKYISTATSDFLENGRIARDLQTITSGASGLKVKKTALDILKTSLRRVLPFSA